MFNNKKDLVLNRISTHKSLQYLEESVETKGDGFDDSSVPKVPKTDCFYDNVSNWAR